MSPERAAAPAPQVRLPRTRGDELDGAAKAKKIEESAPHPRG